MNVNANDTGQNILNGLHDYLDRLSGSDAGSGSGHLGYLYCKWLKHPCAAPDLQGAPPPMGAGDEENNQLKTLYGINFGNIFGAAERQSNLASAANELSGEGSSMSRNVSNVWSDRAGQAATERFTDLSNKAKNYGDSATAMSAAVNAFWQNARPQVTTLADFGAKGPGQRMMGFYGTEDQLNVGDWSRAIDRLYDIMSKENQSVQQLQAAGNSMYTHDHIDSYPKDYTNDVINYLNDFAHNYVGSVTAFRQAITTTVQQVSGQLQELQNAVGQGSAINTDPFGGLSVSGAPPAAPGTSPGGPGSTTGGGGGYTGGGGRGGGSAGAGGGTAAASFTPPPLTNFGASGGGGTATATPGMPTPAATPAMPGMPLTTSGPPESVTIKNSDGSSTTVSGSAGQDVKITDTDGSGKSTSYDVNLGQGGGAPGATAPGSDPTGGGAGQPGAQPVAGQNVQHVTADASGHAVIHNGQHTIDVQEQPGTQGPVNVTLTDPSGHAQTYQIDPAGTPAPGTTPGNSGAASAFGGGGGSAVGGGQPSGLGSAFGHGGSAGAGGGGGVTGGAVGGGGAAVGGGMAGGGAGGGAVVSGASAAHSGASPNWPGQDQSAGAGGASPAAQAGGAGGQSSQSGGMPMMGGMGGMGGGGAGADQERGASQWRIQGQLFDDPSANDVAAGVSAMLDEDPAQQGSSETGGA
ncbi:MAG TPA: hypothetical protein VG317_12185 [Pseudonocardiaceae bacterium]|nr:hypothetical protein [Pseudonocardiaceae bacterium]